MFCCHFKGAVYKIDGDLLAEIEYNHNYASLVYILLK